MKKFSSQSDITKILQGVIKGFINPNGPLGAQALTSISWHSENIKAVFESLETVADGLSKEEIKKGLPGTGRIAFRREKNEGHCYDSSPSSIMC
jgi:hypothetical protein